MDADINKMVTCFGILLLIIMQNLLTVVQSCDEAAVQKCPQDLEKTGLLFTDPCLYFSSLESCLAPFGATCMNSVTFALVVEDMMTMKSIFCPSSSGCDLSAVDRCLKMLDFSKLNMSDSTTYPPFCGDGNIIYKPFEECYNEAAPPCSEDPTFMASQIESIALSVSMVCLSTDDCNYVGMSQCGMDMGSQLANVAPIPNTDTYNGLCSTSEQFISCLDPIISRCDGQTSPKLPFFEQSKQIMYFVRFNCYHNKEELMLHATCLDKPSTSDALSKCTVSDVSDDICQVLISYVECVYSSVLSTCNEEAALTAARFAETYGKNTSHESLGASCNFTKYSQVTTPPADRPSSTAATVPPSIMTSLRPSPLPTTRVLNTKVIDTTTKILTTKPAQTSIPTTRPPPPTTPVPTTHQPTTRAPTTHLPTTHLPTTHIPTTQKPTTQNPTTQNPTTQVPTTAVPTTSIPTTPTNVGGSTKGTLNGISNRATRTHSIHIFFIVASVILIVL